MTVLQASLSAYFADEFDSILEICLDKKRDLFVSLFQDFVRISSPDIDVYSARRSYSVSKTGLNLLIISLQEVEEIYKRKRSGSGSTRGILYKEIDLFPHFEMKKEENCHSEIMLTQWSICYIVTTTKNNNRMCFLVREKDISKLIKTLYFISTSSIWDDYEKPIDYDTELLFQLDDI